MKKANQVKTIKALEKRIKELTERYTDTVHRDMVESVNFYLEHNPPLDADKVLWGEFEKFTSTVCLSGTWLPDRLRDYIGLPHHATYKKTLARRVRKALGYTY